jgi:hypothetical protein
VTLGDQFAAWLRGESFHLSVDDSGFCVPDHSCCIPELGVPIEVRVAFAQASREGKDAFTRGFYAAFLNAYEARGGSVIGPPDPRLIAGRQ